MKSEKVNFRGGWTDPYTHMNMKPYKCPPKGVLRNSQVFIGMRVTSLL